ncbi:MAG: hypothetical protein H0W61_15460 [Bacteroidetes bacterium]|nr:hypothetical protein [Bacteroidota bacterium]
MKNLLKIVLPLFLCLNITGQTNALHLSYSYAGIGTNLGKKNFPLIEVKNHTITYTIETDTAYSQAGWTSKPKTFTVTLRQGSLDSINTVLKSVKDTLISEYNPCVQNGGVHFLRVSNGQKHLSFELTNTFHLTAVKITKILNSYIPKGYGVAASEKDVQEAYDCWTHLRGKWVKQKPDETKHEVKKPAEKK